MKILRSIRGHLTYANVTATLALFIAIGGSSYAALRIGSREIVDNSVRSGDIRNNHVRSRDIRNRTLLGRDIRRNALGPDQIREQGLGPIPQALNSDRLGGLTAIELKVRCPEGTTGKAAACIETTARAPAAFPNASGTCGNAGRRLPDYSELNEMQRTGGQISPTGEWTSSVYRNPANGPDISDQLEVIVVTTDSEGVTYRRAITADQLPFRCVALPSN
jgi:hypothetical protein